MHVTREALRAPKNFLWNSWLGLRRLPKLAGVSVAVALALGDEHRLGVRDERLLDVRLHRRRRDVRRALEAVQLDRVLGDRNVLAAVDHVKSTRVPLEAEEAHEEEDGVEHVEERRERVEELARRPALRGRRASGDGRIAAVELTRAHRFA